VKGNVCVLCACSISWFSLLKDFRIENIHHFKMPFDPQDMLPPPADAVGDAGDGFVVEVVPANTNGANRAPPSLELLILVIGIVVFFHREMGRGDGLGARLDEAGNSAVLMLAVCVALLLLKFWCGRQ